jgi:hypothetical protein
MSTAEAALCTNLPYRADKASAVLPLVVLGVVPVLMLTAA